MKSQVTLNIESNNKEAKKIAISAVLYGLRMSGHYAEQISDDSIETEISVNDNNSDQTTMKLE